MATAIRVLVLAALASCGGGTGGSADGGDASDSAVDAATDAPACASAPMSLPAFGGQPWAIAIDADGTTYVADAARTGAIARWTPGSLDLEPRWLALPGQPFVLSLAIDPASRTLYAATNAGLWRVDTRVARPEPERLADGQHRTVTIGPGGEPYFTSPTEHVARWTAGGARAVSMTAFGEPSALLFDADGTLLLADLLTGLHRLTLDEDRVESAHERLLDVGQERIDALGRDALGRYYLGFSFGDGLQRYPADLASRERVLDVRAVRDLAFARGFLGCERLYAVLADRVEPVEVGLAGAP